MSAPPFLRSSHDVARLQDVNHEAQIGQLAPDFPLPEHFQQRQLCALRGMPLIMVFSLPVWNPSAPEQLSFLKSLLAYCAPNCTNLRALSFENEKYALRFESPHTSTTIAVLRNFDPSGDIARMYGVQGERAVVVIDAEGIMRERYLIPNGKMPRADRVQQTFEKIRTYAKPPQRRCFALPYLSTVCGFAPCWDNFA